jgi:hypothetical protein
VNGGYDVKFEADPTEMDLKGIVTPREYVHALEYICMRFCFLRTFCH